MIGEGGGGGGGGGEGGGEGKKLKIGRYLMGPTNIVEYFPLHL